MSALPQHVSPEQATTSPVLEVRNLKVEFRTEHGPVTVVDDVSFDVAAGETVGLVGESGSGKTVTSLSIMGLITSPGRISGGSIVVGGQDLTKLSRRRLEDVRGDRLAMVFQEPMTSLNPAFKVGAQIAETVRRHRKISRREAHKRAVELLDLVGIPNAARRAEDYPHEFSGGMRQRVVLAIALSCDPELLIADEPTTALDVTVQAQILDLIKEMRREFGMAVLFVTHDLGVVADVCDRVLVMYAGQVVESGDINSLFYSPSHPYTEGLLGAMPRLDDITAEVRTIPGSTPAPWDQPVGCRFHPRCPYVTEACTAGPIPLLARGDQLSRCIRVDELTLRGSNG